MNEGVLNFTLGLLTGGFLSNLEKAKTGIKGLATSFLALPGLGAALGGAIASVSSISAVVEGVFNAIDQGTALERLSKRTSTSVGDLYRLQMGFRSIGLSVEDVGPTIYKLQKALGGVNEFGEDTRSVFYQMGLSLEKMKGMNAPQQFDALGKALGRLNTAGAASAVGTIFGRGDAQMLQLARSTGDFAAAMAAAAADAATFQRTAASFEKIDQALDLLRAKTQTLFAGMAEGAAPAIQGVVNLLNRIDLSHLGQEIGHVFTAIAQSFSEGNLLKLIGLTFLTGAGIFYAAMATATDEWHLLLLKGLVGAATYLAAGLTWAFEHAFAGVVKLENMFARIVNVLGAGLGWVIEGMLEKLGKVPKLGALLGLSGFQGKTFTQMLGVFEKQNPSNKGSGVESFGDILARDQKNAAPIQGGLSGAMAAEWAALKKSLQNIPKPLEAFVHGLLVRAPKPDAPPTPKPGQNDLAATNYHYKPEFTDLEKMGAISKSGTNNPLMDFARRTAVATERIAAAVSPQQGGAAPNPLGGIANAL